MVQIYHNDDFLNYSFNKVLDFSRCKLVGQVDTDDLETAYADTQNIYDNWNPSAPCRSSSVGDVFKLNDSYFVVESCGFRKIEL